MSAPHVLIVEDDPLVTDALRILLESTGHRVTSAHSVRDAIERCAAEPPDVMLLDLTLPDGDGLEVLARVRERGTEPGVTAAFTGHDDERVVERCVSAGCREVLVKPVSIRVLLAKMSEWLGS